MIIPTKQLAHDADLMQKLSATMEQVYIVKKYREYYKEYKANPSDKAFSNEYKS